MNRRDKEYRKNYPIEKKKEITLDDFLNNSKKKQIKNSQSNYAKNTVNTEDGE